MWVTIYLTKQHTKQNICGRYCSPEIVLNNETKLIPPKSDIEKWRIPVNYFCMYFLIITLPYRFHIQYICRNKKNIKLNCV